MGFKLAAVFHVAVHSGMMMKKMEKDSNLNNQLIIIFKSGQWREKAAAVLVGEGLL